MRLSPRSDDFLAIWVFELNGTIVFTWGLMLVLALGSN